MSDQRIRLQIISKNLGISGNSNLALDKASGEWAILLDHDDLLSPEALFQLAKTLNESPTADFIYSDKDMVDRTGNHRYARFSSPAGRLKRY